MTGAETLGVVQAPRGLKSADVQVGVTWLDCL